jgi:hypothetical protein
LTYEFSDLEPASAVLQMKWERVTIPLTLTLDVHRKALREHPASAAQPSRFRRRSVERRRDAAAPQLYSYADGLMREKRRDEGLALFQKNAERHPAVWIAIAGRALAKAPGEGARILVERLLARLDAGEDIGQ